MLLGHLLHDNYQTRQFSIIHARLIFRRWAIRYNSEKDISPFGSVSVASKVSLPYTKNIPKLKIRGIYKFA